MDLATDDVVTAGAWLADLSGQVPQGRWDVAPGPDAWSPRRTLDHCVDAMFLYSAYVARRATGRLPSPRDGDGAAAPSQLVEALVSSVAVLRVVLGDLGNLERAFHPSGNADRAGWIGMACTELLVHGHDLAVTAGIDPVPVLDDLAAGVVGRVLPWAPQEGSGWQRLLWATGRAPLGTRPAEPATWWWQSAPLAEWDGRPRRRSAPPQW